MASKRITTLTPEQKALLPRIRDQWIAAGLSTQPANWADAERGIRAAYKAGGLPAPRIIIHVASPWAGALAQALAPGIIGRHYEVDAQVRAQVGAQVYAQVRAQVRAQVDDQVRAQVRDQVDAQVGAQVYAQVRDQVDAQVRKRLPYWWQARLPGQHWAGYYSYYYAMGQLGVKEAERMAGQMLTALSAGWWWCYAGFAVVTDRPAELHRDSQGRLHSATGPAIRYRDGWGFHAWHGVRVPADLIETDWDLGRILKEPNSEVRRCAIEKTGWERLEAQLGTPVATSPDPGNPGRTLALYDAPDGLYDVPVRLVLMTNGSPDRSGADRRYGETIPAEIDDPLTAQAWAYGVPVKAYAANQRRT